MSIQYMVLGFEPTTSQTWVVTQYSKNCLRHQAHVFLSSPTAAIFLAQLDVVVPKVSPLGTNTASFSNLNYVLVQKSDSWFGQQTTLHFWGRHNSVDSSAPSILRSRVRIPSTPSIHFPFIVNFVLLLSLCCDKDKNKQKEAEFGQYEK